MEAGKQAYREAVGEIKNTAQSAASTISHNATTARKSYRPIRRRGTISLTWTSKRFS